MQVCETDGFRKLAVFGRWSEAARAHDTLQVTRSVAFHRADLDWRRKPEKPVNSWLRRHCIREEHAELISQEACTAAVGDRKQ